MKQDWLITFRSVTLAQKGERALKQAEIFCSLQRTPKMLSERGCGYCLRVRPYHGERAITALREKGIAYGKVYTLEEDGIPREYLP